MSDLEKYRLEIDEIDKELVRLLERRFDTVLQIADYKQARGMKILQSDREETVLKQAVANLNKQQYAEEVIALFRSLLQISRHLQQRTLVLEKEGMTKIPAAMSESPLKLGYQGVAGAFSEEALVTCFGEKHQFINYESFEDVCLALSRKEIDFGILPIENSSTGSINEVYDLILDYGFFIVGEKSLVIQQHLLALPGTKIEEIKAVYSHPQGLAQCSQFLKNYPQWQQIPYQNTAVSAKLVKEAGDPTKAAIAGSRAAELYGLEILRASINDQKDNHTMFIIIGHKPLAHKKNYKVSLVFWLDNQPGALVRLLNTFANFGINMTKLESRPVKYRPWEYVFYVDFEGDLSKENMKLALEEARTKVKDLRFLGSYPKDEGC